jgi:hypothetical protein
VEETAVGAGLAKRGAGAQARKGTGGRRRVGGVGRVAVAGTGCGEMVARPRRRVEKNRRPAAGLNNTEASPSA